MNVSIVHIYAYIYKLILHRLEIVINNFCKIGMNNILVKSEDQQMYFSVFHPKTTSIFEF